MAAALAELTRRASARSACGCWRRTSAARRFYEKAGFTADGERATYDVTLPSGGDRSRSPEIRYARMLDAAG